MRITLTVFSTVYVVSDILCSINHSSTDHLRLTLYNMDVMSFYILGLLFV